MRMYKPRGLNVNESYACNRSAVRKCFESEDIAILWGNQRSYSFDSKLRNLPEMDGVIVASISMNHRNPKQADNGIMQFYIIVDPQYNSSQKQLFETKCLPLLKEWYTNQRQQRLQGGCDEMLVSWNGRSFKLQTIHYA